MRRKYNIINQIRRGVYTYIIFSPKQTISKTFQNALSQPEFQFRINLVAINKYHLIK